MKYEDMASIVRIKVFKASPLIKRFFEKKSISILFGTSILHLILYLYHSIKLSFCPEENGFVSSGNEKLSFMGMTWQEIERLAENSEYKFGFKTRLLMATVAI